MPENVGWNWFGPCDEYGELDTSKPTPEEIEKWRRKYEESRKKQYADSISSDRDFLIHLMVLCGRRGDKLSKDSYDRRMDTGYDFKIPWSSVLSYEADCYNKVMFDIGSYLATHPVKDDAQEDD